MSWRKWLHRPINGTEKRADAAERKLSEARREDPLIARGAEFLAQLPPEEFADRVRRAFGARP